jgi:hypothetical protein
MDFLRWLTANQSAQLFLKKGRLEEFLTQSPQGRSAPNSKFKMQN